MVGSTRLTTSLLSPSIAGRMATRINTTRYGTRSGLTEGLSLASRRANPLGELRSLTPTRMLMPTPTARSIRRIEPFRS